jgi:hypothetical protein
LDTKSTAEIGKPGWRIARVTGVAISNARIVAEAIFLRPRSELSDDNFASLPNS